MRKAFLYLALLSSVCTQETVKAEDESLFPALVYSATTETDMEQSVFNLINQNRVANFLKPLAWSDVIAKEARSHSTNMANYIVPFGHQGVQDRFLRLMEAIPTLTKFGENVAYNYGYSNPVQVAVSGWLKSPGHYANIMGDFNQTGVGVAKSSKGEYYFTQIFVKASEMSLEDDNSLIDEEINEEEVEEFDDNYDYEAEEEEFNNFFRKLESIPFEINENVDNSVHEAIFFNVE